MIRLTTHDGRPMWMSPEDIKNVTVVGEERLTSVNAYHVKESPEEVVRKIMEYKLAMVRYGAASNVAVAHADPNAVSDYAEGEMNRLAGLEESPDA